MNEIRVTGWVGSEIQVVEDGAGDDELRFDLICSDTGQSLPVRCRGEAADSVREEPGSPALGGEVSFITGSLARDPASNELYIDAGNLLLIKPKPDYLEILEDA